MTSFFDFLVTMFTVGLTFAGIIFVLSVGASVVGPILRNHDAKWWTEKNDLMDFSLGAILFGYLGLGYDEKNRTPVKILRSSLEENEMSLRVSVEKLSLTKVVTVPLDKVVFHFYDEEMTAGFEFDDDFLETVPEIGPKDQPLKNIDWEEVFNNLTGVTLYIRQPVFDRLFPSL